MSYKCIGCDGNISWDGKGLFSYTCPCGSHAFYNEETKHLSLPFSFVRGLQLKAPLPHLNYLVGESNHTSPIKEQLIKELREKGSIWMEECEQCKGDGTLKRKQEREKYLAIMEAEAIMRRNPKESI